jgi:hypothetical protein
MMWVSKYNCFAICFRVIFVVVAENNDDDDGDTLGDGWHTSS